MLSVVCWQWNNGFRDYKPARVNVLASMIRRHLTIPHRFICIADDIEGYDPGIEVLATPPAAQALASIPSPEGKRFPASYRRLWTFSEEARCLGDLVLALDIDCLVTADLAPLVDTDADFVGWRPHSIWGKGTRIGGGTWLLRTGTHGHIFERFSVAGAHEARRAGFRGSDQAWLSYLLTPGCRVWPKSSGIYQSQDGVHKWHAPPADARIVHFNGERKPWQCLDVPWVQQHYR